MRRWKNLLAALIAVGAALYLVAVNLGGSATYYLTVSEVQARAPALEGRAVRVHGTVADGSVRWDLESFQLSFEVAEGESRLPVRYRGARPDGLEAGRQVVVEGRLQPDGTLAATQVMVQCPSRYEPART